MVRTTLFLVAVDNNKPLRANSQHMFVFKLPPYGVVSCVKLHRKPTKTSHKTTHRLRSFCFTIEKFHFQSVYRFGLTQCIDETLMEGKDTQTE